MLTERVEYLDENGKLVTESLRDYSRKTIRQHYASLDQFLHRWKTAERKEAIIEELAEEGLLLDPLLEEVGKDLDPFDLICHIAFDQPPLTRRDRVGKRAQARCVHPVRPAGPRRARSPAGQISGRRRGHRPR